MAIRDLKSPLTSILAGCELLRGSTDDEELLGDLNDAARSAPDEPPAPLKVGNAEGCAVSDVIWPACAEAPRPAARVVG